MDKQEIASASPPLLQKEAVIATSTHSEIVPISSPPLAERFNVPSKTNGIKFFGSNLRERLLGDVAVAVGVTLGVAPFVCVIDKAIVQRSAGTHSIISSSLESIAKISRNPVNFVKSPMFLMMWGVYAATYATANSLKSIVEHREYHALLEQEERSKRTFSSTTTTTSSPESDSTGKAFVFVGTTVVNSASSLLKDRAYARMFGTSGVAKMPLITYGLWATRDCLVVGSSFILPDMMSKFLQDEADMNHVDAKRVSQVVCPIATQFVVGPIQLLGLDFYNRPMANKGLFEAAVDRTRFLVRGFTSVVSARIARIAPAYAIGGVFNTHYRDLWRQRLIQKEISRIQSGDMNRSATRLVGLVTGK